MAQIPKNYPVGCSDEEILKTTGELSQEIIESGGNINVILRFSPIISVGQSELQKRILERNQKITSNLHEEVKSLSDSTKENIISSEKFSKSSIRVSVVALIVSIIAVGISIYFSFRSNQETQQWRQEEIDLLQRILEK